ncbi:MAG: crossover junction endodeoxyribonuclease RuvC [Gammaproteobacteria bacterium]|nr:crossover junction endodeoxyribonuclease RuvC [Acholeplasmataceae bacterium]MCK9529025.1 crossover junction endodeoxyribonuclease RuvC [Gammaproteobacteria bacterium]
MLIIPQPDDRTACIIGIDPGTRFMGLGVIFFNVLNLEIIQSGSTLLRGDALIENEDHIAFHGSRFARLHGIENRLHSFFTSLNPLCVAAESNFMNTNRPTAYGALVESVACIRSALFRHRALMELDLIEPSPVKNAVGCKGNAGKEDVNAGVERLNPILKYVGISAIKDLTEHETDGLAIAYWRYLLLVNHAQALNQFKGS